MLEDGHDMAKLPRSRNHVPLEHEIEEEKQTSAPPRKVGLKRAVRESVLSWCGIMAKIQCPGEFCREWRVEITGRAIGGEFVKLLVIDK